ncbi:MAG TPA: RHS repeat domain-containing protein [Humisphaera sp.]
MEIGTRPGGDPSGEFTPQADDSVRVTTVGDAPVRYGNPGSPLAAVAGGAGGGSPHSLLDPLAWPTVSETDLATSGFGGGWGHTRVRAMASWQVNPTFGTTWAAGNLPFLIEGTSTVIAVLGGDALYFDRAANGAFDVRFFGQERLTYEAGPDLYTLSDTTGAQIVFQGFKAADAQDLGNGVYGRGAFKAYVDANGNGASVADRTALGNPKTVLHGAVTGTSAAQFKVVGGEQYTYAYTKDAALGAERLRSVTLSRGRELVRKALYSYYELPPADGATGVPGDLRYVTIKDPRNVTVDLDAYAYGGGVTAFGSDGIARMRGLAQPIWDPTRPLDESSDEAGVPGGAQPYASITVVGDSVTYSGGLTVAIGDPTDTPVPSTLGTGRNAYAKVVSVAYPDRAPTTYFLSYANQVLKTETKADPDGPGGPAAEGTWTTTYLYDADSRLLEATSPSGLKTVNEYYGGGTGGGPAGFVRTVKLVRDEHAALQSYIRYEAKTDGSDTLYTARYSTVFRNETEDVNDPSALTTETTHQWAGRRITQTTVTPPIVPTSENGTGNPEPVVTTYDGWGRVATTFAGGTITTYTYDLPTGAVTKTRVQGNHGVDVAVESGGLDSVGRPGWTRDANGVTSYVRYKDRLEETETRSYPAWVNGGPTGPTLVSRADRRHGYTDAITMRAEPAVSNGTPTGGEAIAQIRSLTRNIYESGGRVASVDRYTIMPGAPGAAYTYDPAVIQYGTNLEGFFRRSFQYRADGQVELYVSGTTTRYATTFDSLGRPVSKLVGTTPQNMVVVEKTEYDGNGVGDGNVTRTTGLVHVAGQPDQSRVVAYDWRGRGVLVKQGDEPTESDDVNRPLTFVELDNLGRARGTYMYDGDGFVVPEGTAASADPPRPSETELRGLTRVDYDSRGRAFRTARFNIAQGSSVDPTTPAGGDPTADAHGDDEVAAVPAIRTLNWYDARGNVVASQTSGGPATVAAYDALGRVYRASTTDGAGDPRSASDDRVLAQVDVTFDAVGNELSRSTAERFHDTTHVGPLTPTYARVSYSGTFFDAAGRRWRSYDLGTNGGSAPTAAQVSALAPPADRPAVRNAWVGVRVTDYQYDTEGRLARVTGPDGLATRYKYDHLGRLALSDERDTGGPPGERTDITRTYTYDGEDHRLTEMQLEPGATEDDYLGHAQVTRYSYVPGDAGTSSPFKSYDVLWEVTQANGDVQDFVYNAIGQPLREVSSQSGRYLFSTYDATARRRSVATADDFGSPGNHVDQDYDVFGRVTTTAERTAADAPNPSAVLSEVRREYNGFGDLTREYQNGTGPVTVDTPHFTYAYDGPEHGSRLVSLTYPGGTTVNYGYGQNAGSGTSLDDTISRVTSIGVDGDAVPLETYRYVGAARLAEVVRPGEGVALRFFGQSGTPTAPGKTTPDGDATYTGWDRFGQMIDLGWEHVDGSGHGTGQYLYRVQYANDPQGDWLFKKDLVFPVLSEARYHYVSTVPVLGPDDRGLVADWDAGPISDVTANSAGTLSITQSFQLSLHRELDLSGNWRSMGEHRPGETTRAYSKLRGTTNYYVTHASLPNPSQEGERHEQPRRDVRAVRGQLSATMGRAGRMGPASARDARVRRRGLRRRRVHVRSGRPPRPRDGDLRWRGGVDPDRRGPPHLHFARRARSRGAGDG